MAEPIATVIIPNYNGARFLPRLLASLAEQSDDRLAVIVVDDASTDDSVARLQGGRDGVRLIVNPENRGFAASCNRGLAEAKTPFVALLNNDTHVDRRWLSAALDAFDAPDVAAVASLVLLADPPHDIDSAGDVFSVAGGAVKRGHGHPRGAAAAFSRDCFSACGASAFYRREVLERIGWLDEPMESYYEDVELGFRLAWAGYRCRFAPQSICYHHLSASYAPTGWRYHHNSSRNAEHIWWGLLPAETRRRYGFAHAAFLALQAANKMRQGCLAAWLAGKRAAFRDRRRIGEKREWVATHRRISDAELEARLIHDWWMLHVTSRRSHGAARPDADHAGDAAP